MVGCGERRAAPGDVGIERPIAEGGQDGFFGPPICAE
jgi:hypothetical protein